MCWKKIAEPTDATLDARMVSLMPAQLCRGTYDNDVRCIYFHTFLSKTVRDRRGPLLDTIEAFSIFVNTIYDIDTVRERGSGVIGLTSTKGQKVIMRARDVKILREKARRAARHYLRQCAPAAYHDVATTSIVVPTINTK